jgi:hypothetical protein
VRFGPVCIRVVLFFGRHLVLLHLGIHRGDCEQIDCGCAWFGIEEELAGRESVAEKPIRCRVIAAMVSQAPQNQAAKIGRACRIDMNLWG